MASDFSNIDLENYKPDYNLLNEFKYIDTKDGCLYDSNYGYEVRFKNGEYGWNIPINLEGAGSVGPFYHGISTSGMCYITRQFTLDPSFEAEYFWRFELDMLLVPDWEALNAEGITELTSLSGRIGWKTINSTEWESTNHIDFSVEADGVWHRYTTVEFRGKPGWVGNINNLRLYPFYNGSKCIKIFIRRLAFVSPNYYRCTNRSCGYYDNYTHPCPGAGSFANATSKISKNRFNITSDNNRIGIDIDNRGIHYFDLDVVDHLDGHLIAANLSKKISSFGIGGYALSKVRYDETAQTFSIYTGTRGSTGSVLVYPGDINDASISLGFYDIQGKAHYDITKGMDVASRFEERYKRLPASTLYGLVDSEVPVIYYRAEQPVVTIGKPEAITVSNDVNYWEGLANGTVMIDLFGQADYYGAVGYIFYTGHIIVGISRVLLLRPQSDGSYLIIGSSILGYIDSKGPGQVASLTKDRYAAKVEWSLQPGDVFGLFRCAPAVGKSYLGGSTTFNEFEYRGAWIEATEDTPVIGNYITYTTKDIKIYGYETLPVYAQSDSTINDLGIEISLRSEYGIDSITVVGTETMEILSYNLAKMNGVSVTSQVPSTGSDGASQIINVWSDDTRANNGTPNPYVPYPINTQALTDGVVNALNAAANTTPSLGSDVITSDIQGTYFYLSSDLEWVPVAADFDGKSYINDEENMPHRNNGNYWDWGQKKDYTFYDESQLGMEHWRDGEQRERIEFYIEFEFSEIPGIRFDVDSIIMYFVEEYNLRDFCWEKNVESWEFSDYEWNILYPWPVKMVGDGTEEGWVLLDNPTSVIIDGRYNVTGNPYFETSYVTDWATDNWPDLTSDYMHKRWQTAQGMYWTSLYQEFNTFKTRKLRLYSWRHASTKITEIRVLSKLVNVRSLANVISLKVGLNQPLFNTGIYEITSAGGEKTTTTRLSEDITYDSWLFPNLEPLPTTSGVVSASIGAPVNRIELEISGLDVDISTIWIRAREKAIRILDKKTHPVTAIDNLECKLPTTITGINTGKVNTYNIYNDNQQTADLYVDLAHTTGISSVIFKSELSSIETINDPEIGPPATLLSDDDFFLTANNCINYQSKVYYLEPISISGLEWYRRRSPSDPWIKSRWGNPVTEVREWNEAKNPYNLEEEWQFFNLYTTNRANINKTFPGFMYIRVNQQDTDNSNWNNPTYYRSVTKDESLVIRTRIDSPLTYVSGTESAAGIVIFDEEDKSKYIEISRYTGNGVTVSGGDWVRIGQPGNFTYTPYTEEGIVPHLKKTASTIEATYRTETGPTFSGTSFFNINNWSNNLKMGAFVSYKGDGGSSSKGFKLDYVGTLDVVDNFNTYKFDFLNDVSSYGDWEVSNPHLSYRFDSYSNNRFYIESLDNTNLSASAATELRTQIGQCRGSFEVVAKFRNIVTGNSTKIGYMINHPDNMFISASLLIGDGGIITFYCVDSNINMFESKTSISQNTVWLKLTIDDDSNFTAYYSLDGETFIQLGNSIEAGWPSGNLEFSLGASSSAGLASVLVEGMELNIEKPTSFGYDDEETIQIAVRFPTGISFLDAFGLGIFYINSWSSSSTDEPDSVYWVNTKPDSVRWVLFDQHSRSINGPMPRNTDLTDTLKLYVNPEATNQYDYGFEIKELPNYKNRIWKYCNSYNSSYEPYYDLDYPILLIDLGKPYSVNRLKNTTARLKGKFGATYTDDPYLVEWEDNLYSYNGMAKKCLYSSNNTCSAPLEWERPQFDYWTYATPLRASDLEYMTGNIGKSRPRKYYSFLPGYCNGLATVGGDMWEVCHIFKRGTFRWWMLTSSDNYETRFDEYQPYQLLPLLGHPEDKKQLTSEEKYWESDYGNIEVYGNVLKYKCSNGGGWESFYINKEGCEFFRFDFDKKWTAEDLLQLQLKSDNPNNIEEIVIFIGRDSKRCFSFSLDSVSSTWKTYSKQYSKDAELRIESVMKFDKDVINEPYIMENDDEFSLLGNLENMPIPYLNYGYIEIYVKTIGSSDTNIYVKDLKHVRNKFNNTFNGTPATYLGKTGLLKIDNLAMSGLHGTIEFDYQISPGYWDGLDPRRVVFSTFILTGNNGKSIALVYNTAWGWQIYLTTNTQFERLGNAEGAYVSARDSNFEDAKYTIPGANNTNPLHIVVSWDAYLLPGLDANVALWVNGRLVLKRWTSMISLQPSQRMSLVLGKGLSPFYTKGPKEVTGYAAYQNLKVSNFPVGLGEISADRLLVPERYIDLSKDGHQWYNTTTSSGLPLIYKGLEDGEYATVYLRNRMPHKDVKAAWERQTGRLKVEWELK